MLNKNKILNALNLIKYKNKKNIKIIIYRG